MFRMGCRVLGVIAVVASVGCGSGGGKSAGPEGGGAGGGGAGGAAGGSGGQSDGRADGAADAPSSDAPDADAGTAAIDAEDGGTKVATMFLPDNVSGVVYRYEITPNAPPTLNATIVASSNAHGAAVRSTGELFVGDSGQAPTISRFLSPLGTPIPNGTISGAGLQVIPEGMRFVDDELWVPSATAVCSATPEPITRFAFDAQGNASVAGTVTMDLIGADRGMFWDPGKRDLFVSQCYPDTAVRHYHVANDHTVTQLAAITGNGLINPSGIVMTPWGELLVADFGQPSTSTVAGNTLWRFTLDSQGNATANGKIVSDQLDSPNALAFAPWGELFVVNTENATVARFTFDASHAAMSSGTVQTNAPSSNGHYGLGSIAIVPGPSFGDGGVTDGSVPSDGSRSDAATE